MSENNRTHIMVCTEHKGVFAGFVDEVPDLSKGSTVVLYDARMCIRWANGKGVLSLADIGPDKDTCKISSTAPVVHLNGITAVCVTSEKAAQAWQEVPTYGE